MIDLPITIGDKTYFHPTQIFKNLPVPLLIGDDFLEKHQDTLSFNGSTAELTLIDSELNNTQFINNNSKNIKNKILNKTEELNDSIPLQTAKQRIPANTF